MSKEIEYSAQARSNPVYLTAKTAACLMADAGFAGAEGAKWMERCIVAAEIIAHPDSDS